MGAGRLRSAGCGPHGGTNTSVVRRVRGAIPVRTVNARTGITGHVASLIGKLSPDGAAQNLAWIEQDKAWVGAASGTGSGAMVAHDPDRPMSVAFWSALRTQSTMLPLLLLLAMWFAHSIARNHVHVFRQLRRAIAQLPGRRVALESPSGLVSEVHQLVDTGAPYCGRRRSKIARH